MELSKDLTSVIVNQKNKSTNEKSQEPNVDNSLLSSKQEIISSFKEANNIRETDINEEIGSVGVIYVSDFGAIGDGVTDDTNNIQQAINTAISENKRLVFDHDATYAVSSPINVNNTGNTTKSLDVDFNGAVLKAVAPINSILYLTLGSNNGKVVHNIKNLNLDATLCDYGIYAYKSIRLRCNNINITNGKYAAFYIKTLTGNVENYLNNFSFWRTESANGENQESYGIYCGATDSCFSNGVIVNYKTACRGGGANYFSFIHPWYYYSENEPYNKEVLKNSRAFLICGQSVINACEFDSCNVCVEQASVSGENNPLNDASSVKTPISIVGCSLVISQLYESAEGITPVTVVKLRSGIGSNISVGNFNMYQTYSMDTCFCNESKNEISYDFSGGAMLNLPKPNEICNKPSATVIGDDFTVNATEIAVLNTPSLIFASKENIMPFDKIQNIENKNGINVTVDTNSMEMHFSHPEGVSEVTAATSIYISGTYLSGAPGRLILKKGRTYCFLRPLLPSGVGLKLFDGQHDSSVAISIESAENNPYQLYVPETDMVITGIALYIPSGTNISGYVYRPAIYCGGRPRPYSPPSGLAYTDYSEGIQCDGMIHLVSLQEMKIRYKYGDIVTFQEYSDLVQRVTELENLLEL